MTSQVKKRPICYPIHPLGASPGPHLKKRRALVTCFPMRNQIQVTPEGGADGARGSGLIEALKAGMAETKLTDEELRRIATWIDLKAVYYGVYEPAEQLAMQREGKPVPMPCSMLAMTFSGGMPAASAVAMLTRMSATNGCCFSRMIRNSSTATAAATTAARYVGEWSMGKRSTFNAQRSTFNVQVMRKNLRVES